MGERRWLSAHPRRHVAMGPADGPTGLERTVMGITNTRATKLAWLVAVLALLCASLVVAPPAAQAVTGPVSDDFSGSSLGAAWTFTDPVGDDELVLNGSQAVISVAPTVAHEAFKPSNKAPRLLQAAPAGDFSVQAKFDTPMTTKWQEQGIVVAKSATEFLRFEVYYDGSLHGLAAQYAGSATPVTFGNTPITASAPVYLRVTRTGDDWVFAYSDDGTTFTEIASFTLTYAPVSFGPYAGNKPAATGSAPGFNAAIDYFANVDDLPLSEGDTPDGTAPVLSAIGATPSETGATIDWTTDEGATSVLKYGTTTAYGTTTSSTLLVTSHSVDVSSLTCGTTYHYQVASTDSSGNPATSADQTFDTLACSGPTDTVFNVWYGDNQMFGNIGHPQPWINILGNISDPNGLDPTSGSYTLNGGGTAMPFSIGPNGNRLAAAGDFNLDIPLSSLVNGTNTVELSIDDALHNTANKTVTFSYNQSGTWPLPDSVDWGSLPGGDLQKAVQVVDGKWQIAGGGVRTAETGYDRLLAIGEQSWGSYEVTAPITVHQTVTPPSGSGQPAVGFIQHWNGHYDKAGTANCTLSSTGPCEQPFFGFTPLGALGWYRFGSAGGFLQMMNSNASVVGSDTAPKYPLGTTFNLKMRVENLANGDVKYSLKSWAQGADQPTTWNVEDTQAGTDAATLTHGSLLLVAHYTDVTFGDVTVTPLASTPPGNTAPTVDAGPDAAITLPTNSVALDGTVNDADSDPLTTTWTKSSGPGTVTFADASAVDTTATFSAAGDYVLQLEANDGTDTTPDTVTITVNPEPTPGNTAPTVDAGPDAAITLPTNSVALDGTVNDADSDPLTTTWTKSSGPGTVTFADASAVDTTATFSAAGDYVLQLEANDGTDTTPDTVTITVNPEPTSGGGGGGGGGGTPPPPTPSTTTASSTVSSGGTLSTAGTEADAANPIITSVTSPNGGTVDITESSTPTGTAPAGFQLLGVQVDVTAPAATAENPLVIRFRVDGSLLPDSGVVAIFRDGVPVAACTSGATGASPDPCVVQQPVAGSDDVIFEVRTSHASQWNIGVAQTACPAAGIGTVSFSDIGTTVHRNNIRCIAWWGVARGISASLFGPGAPVTRAQMASFLVNLLKAAGVTLPQAPEIVFRDISGSVHQYAISQLAELGIVSGTGTDTYGPGELVTRAQMATMISNVFQRITGNVLPAGGNRFADVAKSVHRDAIERLAAAGIASGVTSDTFAPGASVSRGQMSSFLANLLQLLVRDGSAQLPS